MEHETDLAVEIPAGYFACATCGIIRLEEYEGHIYCSRRCCEKGEW